MAGLANPLDGLDEFKATPKPATVKNPEVKKLVDEIAHTAGFPSRQPPKEAPPATTTKTPGKTRRVTGRNQQLNAKVTAKQKERFKDIAVRDRLVEGELIRQALDAYEYLKEKGELSVAITAEEE